MHVYVHVSLLNYNEFEFLFQNLLNICHQITSQLQPMDQGIINVGKGNYKKRLVKKMLDGLDESDKIVYPNVKEDLYMLVDAWNDVSKSIF